MKKGLISVALILLATVLVVTGCTRGNLADGPTISPPQPPVAGPEPAAPSEPEPEPPPPEEIPAAPPSYALPTANGEVVPQVLHESRKPWGEGVIGIGEDAHFDVHQFDVTEVTTVRPDIFQPGHFSIFDILVHLDQRGDIELEYHFDETMNTHVIDSLDGESGWWYYAYYSGGWRERNVFRMDMYPFKTGSSIRLFRENENRLERFYATFRNEVTRLESNEGQVIIPEVTIRSPEFNASFSDVVVTPHNVRRDLLQPGVITALDILLSLLEQGELTDIKLTWYEGIGTAEIVDSFWTEQIDEAIAYSTCGFVYETGAREFSGFRGTHIHIPSDTRAIVSPDYALWFWICL